IRHLVVAVNKMDLVNFSEHVFQSIREDFTAFAPELDIPDVHFIPVSALNGDNVVQKSKRMPWFAGEPLLEYLENVHIASDRNLREMRFPVQYVIRPSLDFRGYAGQVVSGVIRPGDKIMVLPSGRQSTVKSIIAREGPLQRAFAPMSVTICLEDDIDIGRGDMLVHPGYTPHVTNVLDARVVWMSSSPLKIGRPYCIKHTTHEVKAIFRSIRHKINVNTLERLGVEELALNDIGSVIMETTHPVYVDPYRRNRATGSFIVIDSISNETVAAGMVTGREVQRAQPEEKTETTTRRSEAVTPAERKERYGHRPALVCLQDRAVAEELERILFQAGCRVATIEPERHGDAFPTVAAAMLEAGLIVICCIPSEGAVALKNLSSHEVIAVPRDTEASEPAAAATAACRHLSAMDILIRDIL
ncbi:MAG: sulfate adenylyltransferase, partial [Acidobacteriaceae bacterium]|nr:sulfate adenylyltransferase [Acidobacteriaceae bacterium]